jgi:hypothetical protein
MTLIADSAEHLRLSRRMLRSTRVIGRVRSTVTPAQSGHPVELDPQGKVTVQMTRSREELQLGAAQREDSEVQLGAAQHEEVQLLVGASCRTRV